MSPALSPSAILTIAFVTALLAGTLLRHWLATRQIRHVVRHRDAVPAAFATSIPLTAHQRAADYTVAKTRLVILELALGTGVTVVWTLLGGLQALNSATLSWLGAGMLQQIALLVGFVLIAGAHVRYFYNQRHAGKGDKWWAWGVAAVSILVAVWLSMLSNPLGRQKLGMPALATPAVAAARAHVPKDIEDVLTSRCAMCHAAEPVWAGLAAPPKGVLLDTPAAIAGNAELVRIQAVLTTAMPPNNITEMTREERIVLANWLAKK
jgi:mono/diheme cytochrome c family protein